MSPPNRTFLHAEADRTLRSVGGRETFVTHDSRGNPVVVKRDAGGLRAERLRERLVELWAGIDPRSSGRREYENLRALARAGIPVPDALGWEDAEPTSIVAVPASAVVLEWVEHTETLRGRLGRADAPERRRWGERLVELVARMHAAGFYHRDLYLQHWILPAVSARGELVLLDVGRTRRALPAPRRRWLVKDLAALLHSTPDAVGPRERLRFLVTWLDRLGTPSGASARGVRRAWARQVLAKQRRMAAHTPRGGEDGDPAGELS